VTEIAERNTARFSLASPDEMGKKVGFPDLGHIFPPVRHQFR
jgi:hypothetical protein